MKNFKVFTNPFCPKPISGYRISKFEIGGTVEETPRLDIKPLTNRQMRKLSNNWANGSQSYYHNGNYYDEIGQPMTKDEHSYYYNKDLTPRVASRSTVQGLTKSSMNSGVGNDSEVFNSRFETINHFPDGTQQTLRTIMHNSPKQSYEIVYDPNNMNIMFDVNGISRAEAMKIINNK